MVVILITTIFFSCTYEPTGSNFVEIEVDEPIGYITLEEFQDTVSLFGDVFLQPNIDVGNRRISSITYSIDNNIIETTNSLEILRIKSFEYSNGYHIFSIEIISNSGTGSLADNFGAEKAIFLKEWVLLIDNSDMIPVEIKNVYPYLGNLKIEWSKNNQIQFGSYILYINDDFNDERVFHDRNITTWIDKSFIGGSIVYRVAVSGYDVGGSGGIPFTYMSKDSLYISDGDLTDTNVKIQWTQNVFYDSFGEYTIYKESNNYQPSEKLWSSENITDTIFIDDSPIFGSEYQYSLRTNHKNGYSGFEKSVAFVYGNQFQEFNSAIICENNNSVYIQTNDKILRLNSETMIVQSELDITNYNYSPIRFSISEDGEYAYLAYKTYISSVNPLSLEIGSTVDVGSKGVSVYGIFQVNNMNQVLVDKYYTYDEVTYYFDGIALISMNNENIDFQLSKSEASSGGSVISNSGEYLVNGFTVFQKTNDTFVEKGNIVLHRRLFVNNDEQLIGVDGHQLVIYNLNDISIVGEISFDKEIENIGYNTSKKLIYVMTDDYLYFYELSSLVLKAKQKINHPYIYFTNNKLISTEGFFIPFEIP